MRLRETWRPIESFVVGWLIWVRWWYLGLAVLLTGVVSLPFASGDPTFEYSMSLGLVVVSALGFLLRRLDSYDH